MKFLLFSKLPFEVTDPIALIECYCFQSDFYEHYDLLLPNRKIGGVSRIGARIQDDILRECNRIIDSTKNLNIFADYKDDLDGFLDLNDKTISNHVGEVSNVISQLKGTDGIGLSKALKILHTLYPGIIPMIDRMLQNEYEQIEKGWDKNDPSQILFDYYKNLKEEPNQDNLDNIFKDARKPPHLTKLRVFDILWWSFLKAKRLKEKAGVNWSIIRWNE
jgi:hypothetical protein